MRPENIELGPTRVVVDLPSMSSAEIVVVLDVLDQLVAQLWESHGQAISQHLLARRRSSPPEVRPDLPF